MMRTQRQLIVIIEPVTLGLHQSVVPGFGAQAVTSQSCPDLGHGVIVNGWSVSLNRTPNVTLLQTYTPILRYWGFCNRIQKNRETSPSTKHIVALFRLLERAQIALTQVVETKEVFNQFRNFRDSKFASECQLFDMSRIRDNFRS
jgi:hypothetical protein